MVLVVLLIIIILLVAMSVLARVREGIDEQSQTSRAIAAAADALERFAALHRRLPCPANPTLDNGDEMQNGATCAPAVAEGTLPWNTLGLGREQALDSWGRKISYRVYTGAAGSLTQAEGVSMVSCDTNEPAPGGATAVGGSAGGLCRTSADPFQLNTTPSQYFAGKGLSLDDSGTPRPDVAFILISHGKTGLGAYTRAGTRLFVPFGDERGNTRETGPFKIRAFSDTDTSAIFPSHFDDLLVYRTLPDLVKRIGLSARDWPELGTTATTFNAPAVTAASGNPAAPGDTGRSTLTFGNAQVSGFSGGNGATNISYDENPAGGGIGVYGNGGNLLSDAAGEFLRVELAQGARAFGVTLNHFGFYDVAGTTFTERAEIRFFAFGAPVGSPFVVAGCRSDGGLASFSISPAGAFNRVEIRALPATSASVAVSATGFLLAAIQACGATGTCQTALAAPANECP